MKTAYATRTPLAVLATDDAGIMFGINPERLLAKKLFGEDFSQSVSTLFEGIEREGIVLFPQRKKIRVSASFATQPSLNHEIRRKNFGSFEIGPRNIIWLKPDNTSYVLLFKEGNMFWQSTRTKEEELVKKSIIFLCDSYS